MAKMQTPRILEAFKASHVEGMDKSRVKRDKTVTTKNTQQTVKTKNDRNAARRLSVKIPAFIADTLITYDSSLWRSVAESKLEINDPLRAIPATPSKVGVPWTLGKVATSIKGSNDIHLFGTPSQVENWAKGLNPSQIRDGMFNLIPDGQIKDFERKYLSKWGDYRKLPWSSWCDKVWDLFQQRNWDPNEAVLEMAIQFVRDEILTSGFVFAPEIMDPSKDVGDLSTVTLAKNSGMPFNTSKWDKIPEMSEWYIDMAKSMSMGLTPDEHMMKLYPELNEEQAKILTAALLFARRQPNGGIDGTDSEELPNGGTSVKMRPVEGVVKADIIAAKPLLDELLLRFREIPAYVGFAGAENIGRFMHHHLLKYDHSMEGDFSSFDASCQQEMIYLVTIRILKELFPDSYDAYFDMIAKWYPSMYLFTPNGVVTATHGLFSGCAWTSVLGTLCNRVANVYTLLMMEINPLSDEVMHIAFGDDTVILSNNPLDLDKYEAIMGDVGMDCNKSKQDQSFGDARYCTFLGYRHYANMPPDLDDNVSYVGIYPMLRSQLFYRERDTDNIDGICAEMGITPEIFDKLRYISKIENWRNHPNRMEVLNFLISQGLPISHVLTPDALPEGLRIGRRSRGLLLREYWLNEVITMEPVSNGFTMNASPEELTDLSELLSA